MPQQTTTLDSTKRRFHCDTPETDEEEGNDEEDQRQPMPARKIMKLVKHVDDNLNGNNDNESEVESDSLEVQRGMELAASPCEKCKRLGVGCYVVTQVKARRKRRSCSECYRAKKHCSFNAPRERQMIRREEGTGKTARAVNGKGKEMEQQPRRTMVKQESFEVPGPPQWKSGRRDETPPWKEFTARLEYLEMERHRMDREQMETRDRLSEQGSEIERVKDNMDTSNKVLEDRLKELHIQTDIMRQEARSVDRRTEAIVGTLSAITARFMGRNTIH